VVFATFCCGKGWSRIHVVFDAAAKCNGIAINDMIHPGPKLQRGLLDVFMVS